MLHFYGTQCNGALVLVQSLGELGQTNSYPRNMKCIQNNLIALSINYYYNHYLNALGEFSDAVLFSVGEVEQFPFGKIDKAVVKELVRLIKI